MDSASKPVKQQRIFLMLSLSLGYMLLAFILVGYKPDQVFLVALVNTLYFLHPATRKFITGFSIFIIYWILFDFMKAFPNYLFNSVDTAGLFELDKSLFHISDGGMDVSLNQYFQSHQQTAFSLLSGFFYINWVPVPLAFAAYLFYTNKNFFLRFSMAFFIVNLIGFIIYYIHPAAPPWYYLEYGNNAIQGTPGSAAGLLKVDEFLGFDLFRSIYSKGSNVFAAMPSLHSSYPLIVLVYGLKLKKAGLNIFFFIMMAGIWFAAVYTSHHYLLDVLAGILCAVAGILLLERVLLRTNWFLRFFEKFKGALN